MSMLLNEEQNLLRDSAREFLAEQSPVSLQRQLRDSKVPQGFDADLWRQANELGWPACVFPEEHGGLGVGYAGLGSIFEFAGRNLAALPLLSSVVLCGELLLRAADAALRDEWLSAIIAGDKRLALAHDESRHHDVLDLNTRARREGNDWVIDGDKWFVIDGVGADAYIVVADLEGEAEPGLFLVPAGAAGLSVAHTRLIDSRNLARLQLSGVRVAAAQRLNAAPARAALEAALDRGRACLAAEALGITREAFERTVNYLKERVQFDVPIGSFQALQHRVARLYTELELFESCVRAVLSAIDSQSPEVPVLASLAKARAADMCEKVLNESVQLHGGIGVTDEYDLGLYFKRARVLQQTLGDSQFHRDRYARLKGF